MSKYTRNQVKIGDEVQFINRYIDNLEHKWMVVAKLDDSVLIVELNLPGRQERRMIDLDDVVNLIPGNR